MLRKNVVRGEIVAARTGRIRSEQTVSWTAAGDERLGLAAPEVVNAFSEADPKSDQVSLGALLGLLLAGQPLFADSATYRRRDASTPGPATSMA